MTATNGQRSPATNIMYKTLGVKWLCEVFCPASAFVTADRDEARNPQRFIHVTVITNTKRRPYTERQ
jgi:hypothetical protein